MEYLYAAFGGGGGSARSVPLAGASACVLQTCLIGSYRLMQNEGAAKQQGVDCAVFKLVKMALGEGSVGDSGAVNDVGTAPRERRVRASVSGQRSERCNSACGW